MDPVPVFRSYYALLVAVHAGPVCPLVLWVLLVFRKLHIPLLVCAGQPRRRGTPLLPAAARLYT